MVLCWSLRFTLSLAGALCERWSPVKLSGRFENGQNSTLKPGVCPQCRFDSFYCTHAVCTLCPKRISATRTKSFGNATSMRFKMVKSRSGNGLLLFPFNWEPPWRAIMAEHSQYPRSTCITNISFQPLHCYDPRLKQPLALNDAKLAIQ